MQDRLKNLLGLARKSGQSCVTVPLKLSPFSEHKCSLFHGSYKQRNNLTKKKA